MNLYEVLKYVSETEYSDWVEVKDPRAEDLTTYKINREKPQLALRWGLTKSESFVDYWVPVGANPNPGRSAWAEILLNGQLVYTHTGVYIDGGNAFVPEPELVESENGKMVYSLNRETWGIFKLFNYLWEYYEAYAQKPGAAKSFPVKHP